MGQIRRGGINKLLVETIHTLRDMKTAMHWEETRKMGSSFVAYDEFDIGSIVFSDSHKQV